MRSFGLILVAVLGYGLIHSILASTAAKALVRRRLGKWADAGYRLAYNVLATLTLLPVLALPASLPDRHLYAIPFPWVALTLAGQALAAVIVIAGLWQTGLWHFLGLEQILHPQTTQVTRLVDWGLYRWVRHPLYTAGLIFIWLVPVMTLNLMALNLGLTLYLIVGALVEERKLLAEFGAAYAAYRRRTPMFLPRLRRTAPQKSASLTKTDSES
jgi:protein-S-isoprenylcysteine O-methyltransferase Ste14